MKLSLFLTAASVCLIACTQNSFSMVIDSFENNAFALSLDSDTTSATTNNGPIGISRHCKIASRIAEEGSSVNVTCDTITKQLLLAINGSSASPITPINAALSYVGGGPYDFSQYSHFDLAFSSVQGTGSVIVEIGNTDKTAVPTSFWIPLSEIGSLIIPFTEVEQDSGQSIVSFSNLSFTFVAESEQFSFTLDEIRAVPEPSSLLLLLSGAGLLWVRRIRQR